MRNFGTLLLGCLLTSLLVSCGGNSNGGGGMGTLSVSPSSATVALGTTQQFSAMLSTGGPTSATWSVNGVQGGNSTVGTIDSNGLYHAPASFPSPDMVTVSASASAGSANATVTVAFPNNNHTAQTPPVKMGTSGGDAQDFTDNGTTRTCCSGTLGALIQRGATIFILSNNHVLARSDAASVGENIQQPGLVDNQCDVASAPPAPSVGTLSEKAALKPSPCTGACTGPAPSNVDAAIAAINAVNVDTSGSILDLGAASSSSIAPAPPSSTLAVPASVLAANEGVAKSGRTTGLTCSNLQSVSTSVMVQYNANCGGAVAFTSTFSNQVVINGGSFSASGDSGSLVVTSDTARPVGLLYAGNSNNTTANPIQDVLTAFNNGTAPTIVGGGDHSVSCDPTATASSASTTVGASAAKLSVQENDRVTAVKEKHANQLLENSAISDVSVGASADNPKEGALLITVRSTTTIPAVIDGVRTRVVYAGVTAPRATVNDLSRAATIKEVHAAGLMNQPGIQGVGVGVSDDNTAEPAMVIYVVSGVERQPIPAVMDGLRTKIIEGDRFRAFGWGRETKSSCSQKQPAMKKSAALK